MSINKAEEAGREKPRGPWQKEVVNAGNRLLQQERKRINNSGGNLKKKKTNKCKGQRVGSNISVLLFSGLDGNYELGPGLLFLCSCEFNSTFWWRLKEKWNT